MGCCELQGKEEVMVAIAITITVMTTTMVTTTLFEIVMGIIKEGSNEKDLLINGE